MSTSRIVLAFLVLVPALGACHRDRCLSVCQQRQKELGCKPSESCKTTCDQLHEESPCSAAMHEWEDCIVSLPTNQWQCNDRNQPTPKNETCMPARVKVFGCISKFPQWPLPKPSPAAAPPKN